MLNRHINYFPETGYTISFDIGLVDAKCDAVTQLVDAVVVGKSASCVYLDGLTRNLLLELLKSSPSIEKMRIIRDLVAVIDDYCDSMAVVG